MLGLMDGMTGSSIHSSEPVDGASVSVIVCAVSSISGVEVISNTDASVAVGAGVFVGLSIVFLYLGVGII